MNTTRTNRAATLTEEDLVALAQGGDHQAFGELVCRHDRHLRALARRLLGAQERAEDALQEAYLKAFRNIRRFRADASVATWLYRITYNACLDELRRRSDTVAVAEDVDRPSPNQGPAETALTSIEVERVLDAMTPEVRTTVVLVHAYGFDYADASRVLGVPAGTIASRLNRARHSTRRATPAMAGRVADRAA